MYFYLNVQTIWSSNSFSYILFLKKSYCMSCHGATMYLGLFVHTFWPSFKFATSEFYLPNIYSRTTILYKKTKILFQYNLCTIWGRQTIMVLVKTVFSVVFFLRLSSPLGSGVFPLCCLGVMVDKVHSVIGVHTPL